MEEATHNELHGTNFELIPCADLFYEDKVGCDTEKVGLESAVAL